MRYCECDAHTPRHGARRLRVVYYTTLLFCLTINKKYDIIKGDIYIIIYIIYNNYNKREDAHALPFKTLLVDSHFHITHYVRECEECSSNT